jgi:hypothetical protein
MRAIVCFLLIVIVLACASPKTDESTDSVALVTDTVMESVPEQQTVSYTPDAPEKQYRSNFPGYSPDLFTDDATEASINEALFKLLDRYDTTELLTITSSYSVTYPVQNEYDEGTTDVTKTDYKTWYYENDSSMTLRAYSHTWEETGYYSGTTICIFGDDEEMIAVYHDSDVTGQDTQISRNRAVFTQCPKCGVVAVNPNMGYGENTVDVLDETYQQRLSTNFSLEYSQLMSFLNAASNTGGYVNDKYRVSEDNMESETAYTIEYLVQEPLTKKFMKFEGN